MRISDAQSSCFIFGGVKQGRTKKNNSTPVAQTGEGELASKQNRRKHSRRKKTDAYVICEQELQAEMEERSQRGAANWKRRAQQKLGKVVKATPIKKDKLKGNMRTSAKTKNKEQRKPMLTRQRQST